MSGTENGPRRSFTPTQMARGILTTFSRGDYSLAVARLRAISSPAERDAVIALVTQALTLEERTILQRYGKDLF